MPLRRPRVFFDTSVYSDAVKQSGGISPEDWRFIRHYLLEHYRVLVSWTTFKELLCRLANCPDQFFVQNQKALKEASRHGPAPGKFLEKPQIFAIRHILGINVYPHLDREGRPNLSTREWTEGVLKAIFGASNKRELANGVRLGPKAMYTFDLNDFAAYEEQARSQFVRLCEGWRTGEVESPNAITVANNLLRDSGLEPREDLSQNLSLALDAVNATMDYWFLHLSKNSTYSFERHKNNWDDIQQLYYLCDASITFVTLNTRDFMKWTRNSTQRVQVMSWQQFLDKARDASR